MQQIQKFSKLQTFGQQLTGDSLSSYHAYNSYPNNSYELMFLKQLFQHTLLQFRILVSTSSDATIPLSLVETNVPTTKRNFMFPKLLLEQLFQLGLLEHL